MCSRRSRACQSTIACSTTIGADLSAKIILHIGGLYAGSETVATDRFCAMASELPDRVRRRLAVENDDRLFDADEVLSIARRLNVPVGGLT